jgi:hypothetical protein
MSEIENDEIEDTGESKAKGRKSSSGPPSKEESKSPLLFAFLWFGIPLIIIIVLAVLFR